MAKYLYNCTVTALLCIKETPPSSHHHVFVFSSLFRISAFIAYASVTYFKTLWSLCTPAVKMGDNFLNLAKTHLILALAASSKPPPEPNIYVSQIFWYTLHPHSGLNLNELNLLQHFSEQNISCNEDQHCSAIYQRFLCTFYEPLCRADKGLVFVIHDQLTRDPKIHLSSTILSGPVVAWLRVWPLDRRGGSPV